MCRVGNDGDNAARQTGAYSMKTMRSGKRQMLGACGCELLVAEFIRHKCIRDRPFACFKNRSSASKLWKLNETVRKIAINIRTICREFVQEKKEKMKVESQNHGDILSIMMRSNNFSDDGLVDQLLTFLAAG